MENPGFISEDLDVTYVAAEQFWENIVKLQVWSKVHLNNRRSDVVMML